MPPLVSVICVCFNHARFIQEALDSVINQTYPNLEIILTDDFSTDNSREIIAEYLKLHPQIIYLPNEKNLGVCATFNRAFAISKGEYIVDFATDDELMPDRILEQVAVFEKIDKSYGVIFTNAELMDDAGNSLGNYYPEKVNRDLKQLIPTGNVFAAILRRHFISPPTLLVRRAVYEKLNGYDASLAYEDFDFWVRSSREFKYFFLNKVLTKRRIHAAQLSQQQYKPNDQQLFSTIKVCRKALQLIRTQEEREALISRIQHELIQAVFTKNPEATKQLFDLLNEMNALTAKFKFLKFAAGLPLPFLKLRQLYNQVKYGK